MSERRWLDQIPSDSVERRLLEAGKNLAAPSDLDASWLDFVGRAGPLSLGVPTVGEPPSAPLPSSGAEALSHVAAPSGAALVPGAIKALVVGLALGSAGIAANEAAHGAKVNHGALVSSPSLTSVAKAPERRDSIEREPSQSLARNEDRPVSPMAPSSKGRSLTHDQAGSPLPSVSVTAPNVREIQLPPAAALRSAESFESSSTSLPPAAAPAAAASPERQNDLRAEARELAAAEGLLRSGRALEARDLLAQAERRFPAGALAQEREVLFMEAMVKTGQRELAAERARSFLQRYPNTPFAARLRKVLSNHE
jgi:hypothetical protein